MSKNNHATWIAKSLVDEEEIDADDAPRLAKALANLFSLQEAVSPTALAAANSQRNPFNGQYFGSACGV